MNRLQVNQSCVRSSGALFRAAPLNALFTVDETCNAVTWCFVTFNPLARKFAASRVVQLTTYSAGRTLLQTRKGRELPKARSLVLESFLLRNAWAMAQLHEHGSRKARRVARRETNMSTTSSIFASVNVLTLKPCHHVGANLPNPY